MENENLKFKLQEYPDLKKKISDYESTVLELKAKIKGYVEELNQLSDDYFRKEEKIKEALDNLVRIKKDYNDLLNSKTLEISCLNAKIEDIFKDRKILIE